MAHPTRDVEFQEDRQTAYSEVSLLERKCNVKYRSKWIQLVGLVLAAAALPAHSAETAKAPAAPVKAPAVPVKAPAAPVVPGLAIANIASVVANSNAFRVASQQRQVTFKALLASVEARRQQIEAQLRPLVDKYQKDQATAGSNQASLQLQAQTIQRIQQSGQQELQRMLEPVSLSEAYGQEQINDKLGAAIEAAMAKKGISLVLTPASAVAFGNVYDLSQSIISELDASLPSVQLIPPKGWQPRHHM